MSTMKQVQHTANMLGYWFIYALSNSTISL